MSITFDATSDKGSFPTGSFTWSHTQGTGQGRILFVGVESVNGDDVTAVTYNSVSMTLVNKVNATGTRWAYLYYLLAPSTGSNTVSVTCGAVQHGGGAISYLGANQVTQVDSSAIPTFSGSSPFTVTTTCVKNNTWLVAVVILGASPVGAGASTTVRNNTSADVFGMGDSNGKKGTGSQSLNFTYSGSVTSGGVIASIVPDTIQTISETQGTTDAISQQRVITQSIAETQSTTDKQVANTNKMHSSGSKSSSTWVNPSKSV